MSREHLVDRLINMKYNDLVKTAAYYGIRSESESGIGHLVMIGKIVEAVEHSITVGDQENYLQL